MNVVAYYRVSTAAQGRSGLGLDAQRQAVAQYCGGRSCEILGEYVEVRDLLGIIPVAIGIYLVTRPAAARALKS